MTHQHTETPATARAPWWAFWRRWSKPAPAAARTAEQVKLQAEMKVELEKLQRMQDVSSAEAHAVAEQALGVMMAMGWTWDAAMVVITDNQGRPVRHEAKLIIRPMKLGEWQAVQKERLRASLAAEQASKSDSAK